MMSIASTNAKGQIVLPSGMRKALKIDERVSLLITLQGSSIQIEPIVGVETYGQKSSGSLLEILRKTRGSWVDESTELEEVIQKREIEITVLGKNAW